jgi:DNA primase catalytic core
MIDKATIEQILNRADIVEVIGSRIELTHKGRRHWACCPFHGEKTASFAVNAEQATYHCFGCGESGNAISFVMKYENKSFPEACKTLASKMGIAVEQKKLSPEEEQKQLKREAMWIANEKAHEFYVKEMYKPKNKAALDYAVSRWGEDHVKEMGLGFAPDAWQNMVEFARVNSISLELLQECSLVRKGDKGYYDFYRNRIMIPIRDRYRHVIGFTARDISGVEGTPKYLNSAESEIYNKGKSLFGIDVAIREAVRTGRFYVVEGAPDVLQMQAIEVPNTLASLGTAWNEGQFESLKKYATHICFIPDSDIPKQGERYGTGIKAVMKNGEMAMRCGFSVSVKEIPTKPGEKQDPGSYCKNKFLFDGIKEEDFILWYAAYKFYGLDTTEERSAAINTVCQLVALVNDEVKEKMYLDELQTQYRNKNLWTTAINQAKKMIQAKKVLDQSKKIDRDLYTKYGFYEEYNAYFSISANGGSPVQWSNFIMIPMFHIKDALNPKRLYRIKNQDKQTEIIEMKQEDLSSLAKFKQRVEGLGNYIWLVTEKELTKLKMFLYAQTETATEITQLGWQRKGFFAFGNGCFDTEWHPTDDYGIVRMKEGNYYLPAVSSIYKEEVNLYQFERKFVHTNFSTVSLMEFTEKLIGVFGNNAKIGICFFLATLFRDVVVGTTKSFPILNLFGPKGSGKSELGHSLMSFFIIKNTPPNIQNSTIAAMSDTVAQCANALVHLDEYKNTIDIDKREFLKGLWDGAGRSRMNMDRDKKREITRVDCGVILSGQEMPTIDIALFSRLIFLTFNKTEFTNEEKAKFAELKRVRDLGLSHIVLEILRYRTTVETGYQGCYTQCMADLNDQLQNQGIEDRIQGNWLIPLAMFKCLQGVVKLPFDYEDLLKVIVEGIKRQNSECKRTNELANFWNVFAYLLQEGEIYSEGDFRIDYLMKFKSSMTKADMEWVKNKPILMMRKNRIFMLYKKFSRQVGDNALPTESLKFYLENSREYMGMKNAVRFKNIVKGVEMTKVIPIHGSQPTVIKTTTVDQAMCFDYDLLRENYGVNLELDNTNRSEEKEQSEENKAYKY